MQYSLQYKQRERASISSVSVSLFVCLSFSLSHCDSNSLMSEGVLRTWDNHSLRTTCTAQMGKTNDIAISDTEEMSSERS